MPPARETPPCPQCGCVTIRHCRFCDWWECAPCNLRGAGKHTMPRIPPAKDKP